MDIKKILNYGLIGLFVITAIVLGFFIFGGEVPDQPHYTPNYTSLLLNWAYILFGIAVLAALIFPIIRLFTRPKEAMKTFIGLGAVLVIILVSYLLADGTPLRIEGYTGSDNVPGTLIFTDTMIFSIYILFGIAILSIIGTEIYKKVK